MGHSGKYTRTVMNGNFWIFLILRTIYVDFEFLVFRDRLAFHTAAKEHPLVLYFSTSRSMAWKTVVADVD